MKLRNISTGSFGGIALLACACLLGQSSATAQKISPVSEIAGESWTGERAVVESVAEIMARQSLRVAEPRRFIRVERKRFEEIHPAKHPNPAAPKSAQWPPATGNVAARLGPFTPQTIGVNFLGVDFFDSLNFLVVPPDSIGAVGPSQVFVVTNGQIKVFDKSGALGSLDVDLDTFFSSVLVPGQFTSDPHVRFDRLSQRWFLTAITLTFNDPEPPNRILVAVSSGPTITSTSSFSFFQFQHDRVGTTPNSDSGGFADYDTLGVDRFALYIGVNVFKTTTLTTTGFVVNKSNLINGTLTVTPFRRLGSFVFSTGKGSGMDTPQGVNNDDPSATEGYFIGVDMTAFGTLNFRRVTFDPGGTPTITNPDIVVVGVPSTAFPLDQVQPPQLTIRPLDAVSDRLFAASIHTNKLTGARSLWTAHNIEVDASGVGVAGGGRNGSRWYEIVNLTGTPTVQQAGTLFDSSSTNPFGYWIPSVAMSGQGHMTLGASRASSADTEGFAAVAVAGRLASDPLGSTQAPTLAQPGLAWYTFPTTDPVQRWGDYSQTVVDPADDQTIWTFQEYTSSAGRWSVQAIQLLAPPPATPISASPSSLQQGQGNLQISVTGSSLAGSAFFDPGPDLGGPGFPNHINASVGGAVVRATTFNNPNSVTLIVSTACAAGGPQDVTITNPDGQSTIGVGLLTIDFLPTTSSLSSNANVGFVGQPLTFVAKANSATSCPIPTGNVTFKDGAATLGTSSLIGGQANFTTSALSAGAHNITAQYNGDFRYSGSTSAPLSQTIVFATSTALASSQNPSLLSASVTFTATVSNVPAGAPGPTGTVTFTDNGSPIGSPVSLSGGVATRSVAFSTAVSHFIQARYSGGSLHNPSSSATLHQRVQAPGVGVSIGSNSPDPVTIGNLVTVTTVVSNTSGAPGAYSLNQSLTGRFVFVSASTSQGSCSGTGPVSCNLGTIAGGGSATITTQLRALFAHDIVVTNSATSTGGTTSTTNNVRVRFRPFHF